LTCQILDAWRALRRCRFHRNKPATLDVEWLAYPLLLHSRSQTSRKTRLRMSRRLTWRRTKAASSEDADPFPGLVRSPQEPMSPRRCEPSRSGDRSRTGPMQSIGKQEASSYIARRAACERGTPTPFFGNQKTLQGNVAGRKPGSRNRLSEEIISSFLRDWRKHGDKALRRSVARSPRFTASWPFYSCRRSTSSSILMQSQA
jgi:hypothetical protein